jgi:hypothetical protein
MYSINPVHGFVLECVLRDAEGSIRNRKMMDGYFSVIFPFQQDNFRRVLTSLGLALPDWNALFDRYFAAWRRADCGFMARIDEFRGASRVADPKKPIAPPRATTLRTPVERRWRRGAQGAHELPALESVHEG